MNARVAVGLVVSLILSLAGCGGDGTPLDNGADPGMAKAQATSSKATWSPGTLLATVARGTSKQSSVQLTVTETVSEASLFVVPEIAGLLQASLQGNTVLNPGTPVDVVMQLSIPLATPVGTYEGTVHLRSGPRTVPAVLKVQITVVEETTLTFTDRAAFQSTVLPNGSASFDDVPAGTVSPFVTGSVTVSNLGGAPLIAAQVRDTLVSLPISFWFPGVGTAPNFLVTDAVMAATAVKLTLPSNAVAIGFDFQCFACGPTSLEWTLLDSDGVTVAAGSHAISYFSSNALFFGIASSVPFRSLSVWSSSGGNWLLDNVKFRIGP